MSNDQYDINKMIAESKGIGAVPLLNQQVPVMHGIPVNGQLMTIDDLIAMSDGEFRELFLAAIISLAGGMYMPMPSTDNVDEDTGEPLDSE